MTFIRLIFLVMLGYLARRLYLGWKSRGSSGGGKAPANSRGNPREGMKDLTDQDIDDADFEEIP